MTFASVASDLYALLPISMLLGAITFIDLDMFLTPTQTGPNTFLMGSLEMLCLMVACGDFYALANTLS